MNKLLLIGWIIALPVFANPASSLSVVGQSQMNWLFWKVYDITLLSSTGRYQDDNYPVALSIQYARDIEASMLVDSTLNEWSRLDVEWKPEWQQQLQDIWPSVKPGDELMLLVNSPGNSQFYYNGELIGEIRDADFAPAFLAIWLSNDTREPQIRRQLLGESDA